MVMIVSNPGFENVARVKAIFSTPRSKEGRVLDEDPTVM